MFVIIFSNGQINLSEINFECREKKWIPLAALKHKDGKISIPCFETSDTAKQFAKRNLPKEWVRGAIYLGDNEKNFILEKGWSLEKFNFPRIFKNHPTITLDFEVLDFLEKPSVLYT